MDAKERTQDSITAPTRLIFSKILTAIAPMVQQYILVIEYFSSKTRGWFNDNAVELEPK